MGHFTVLVTRTHLKSADEQLEPFYAQGNVDDYLMEHDIEVPAVDIESRACQIVEKDITNDDHLSAEYGKLLEAGDYGEICQQWYGGQFDEHGNLYHLVNPNAKWDWYSVGGQWSGYFKLKEGARGTLGKPGAFGNERKYDADVCKVTDIDWQYMTDQKRQEALRNWEVYKAKVAAGEQVEPYFDYDIEQDDTKESYVKRRTSNATFAVLHEGKWFQRDEMGWFGVVRTGEDADDWEKQFEALIASLDLNDEVTVVDCHI